MAGLVLQASDRAYFLERMRRQTNSAVHRRMNVLLLLDDGWTPARIAEALYLDEGTVRDHRRVYEARGRAGVERLGYEGRASLLSADQLGELSAHVENKVPMASKDVCAWVAERFKITYAPNAMTKLLKRLGFVFKKPKCVPAKADAVQQRAFAKDTLEPLMAAAGAERPLYFVDATHPAYTGRPAHGWIRRGQTKELKSNHDGRVRVNLNGALCWHDRTLIHRQEDKITSTAMIALFSDIEARHGDAGTITVVLDNARYNRSKALRAWLEAPGRKITPVYLPPYAPNLNPIERLWLFLKKNTVWNAYFPTFAAFKAAIDGFLENLDAHNHRLRSLLTPKFHFIAEPKNGIP